MNTININIKELQGDEWKEISENEYNTIRGR